MIQQQQQLRHMSNLSSNDLSVLSPRPAHSNSHTTSTPYDSNGYKIIPELSASNMVAGMTHQLPYRKMQGDIQRIQLSCVNLTPYLYDSELLVSVIDFNQKLFPKWSFEMCTRCLTVLKIQQYILNREQMRVMGTSSKVPYVKVNEVAQHIPRLTYMANQDQPQAKRARIS